MRGSTFQPDAPFVEVDGTTLRWDPRDVTNPLLGSVHDPIYQGARRDLDVYKRQILGLSVSWMTWI